MTWKAVWNTHDIDIGIFRATQNGCRTSPIPNGTAHGVTMQSIVTTWGAAQAIANKNTGESVGWLGNAKGYCREDQTADALTILSTRSLISLPIALGSTKRSHIGPEGAGWFSQMMRLASRNRSAGLGCVSSSEVGRLMASSIVASNDLSEGASSA